MHLRNILVFYFSQANYDWNLKARRKTNFFECIWDKKKDNHLVASMCMHAVFVLLKPRAWSCHHVQLYLVLPIDSRWEATTRMTCDRMQVSCVLSLHNRRDSYEGDIYLTGKSCLKDANFRYSLTKFYFSRQMNEHWVRTSFLPGTWCINVDRSIACCVTSIVRLRSPCTGYGYVVFWYIVVYLLSTHTSSSFPRTFRSLFSFCSTSVHHPLSVVAASIDLQWLISSSYLLILPSCFSIVDEHI